MKPWHERDEFWETFAPVLFGEERFEAAPDQVEGVLELSGTEPGARVLDLACGPGRHALEFARRGFRVTGVDRTESYLERARALALAEELDIEWVRADMRELDREREFDLAVNLFTAFGYFEDPEDDRRVAANLVASLRSGGTVVMEMMGKEVLARRFRPRDWSRLPDGRIMLEERRIASGWDWAENRWILLDGDRRLEFEFCHRIYSAAELAGLLRRCGCESVKVFGGLDGRPYDHEAKRLTLVGRVG
jgi:SAM-dependent methyltransferase